MKILSAGLTPAWQQIMVFDRLRPGEVNRAREAVWCGSGKVLNAGLAAHHLGGPSLTLAPLGGPPLAEIEREFAGIASNIHFEDHLEDGRISFDYKLKPGIVTRSNALELMRAVGLEV